MVVSRSSEWTGSGVPPRTEWVRPGLTPSGPLVTVLWWVATLLTLVILDDLTFGPFFWLISRIESPGAAMGAVLAIYIPAQVLIVWRGTSDDPGRFASFFLRRLDLQRRSTQVQERQDLITNRIAGAASAMGLALLIGGVLPPMVLWRRGFSTTFVRRLSLVTATIYAVEFSVLHGLLPSLV